MKRFFYGLICLLLVGSPAGSGSMSLLGVGPPPVAAGGGCSQATNFLSRVTSASLTIDATHTTAYTNFICGMVTDGLITGSMNGANSGSGACGSLFDVIYIDATNTTGGTNTTLALMNLCGTSYTGTVTGTPTFTADKGYQAAASSDLIDTGFNPSSATTPNFVQNSAHMGGWNNTNNTDTSTIMGNSVSTTNFYYKFSDNNLYSRINDASASSGYAISNPIGFLIGVRTGASAIGAYQNGSSLGTGSQASTTVTNANITLLRANGASSSTVWQSGAFSFGASLNSTQATSYFNRMCTYMKAVGNAAGLC